MFTKKIKIINSNGGLCQKQHNFVSVPYLQTVCPSATN